MTNLTKALKRATREDWIEGLYWLLTNLSVGLLPIWGAKFFFVLFNQNNTLLEIIQKGELAVFSASVIAASIYTMTKGWGGAYLRAILVRRDNFFGNIKINFPGASFYMVFLLLFLILSVLFFAGATLADVSKLKLPINSEFLTNGTVMLAMFSIGFSYVINVVDNLTISADDLNQLLDRPLNDMNREF